MNVPPRPVKSKIDSSNYSKYMQTRFDDLDTKLDTKADKAQTGKIYELVDGIAGNLSDTGFTLESRRFASEGLT